MKKFFSSMLLGMILVAGLFIGMIKGSEVRNKWVSKMKFRYEEKKETKKLIPKGGITAEYLRSIDYIA